MELYNQSSVKKCEKPTLTIFFMALMAGIFIALAGLSAGLASYMIENASIKCLVSGLIFPFGLGIIMLMEFQLFTGNCMMAVPFFCKTIKLKMLFRNWCVVYIGNFAGSLAIGYAVFYLDIYKKESFGMYFINTALNKCQKPFGSLVVMGILCNVLVCTGVLLSMSAKDVMGRIIGAYLPVSLFIISGFEHCVANMFYIPAALFCLKDPMLAETACAMGIPVYLLTWRSFLFQNLIPVTLGNIIGGIFIGIVVWNYTCKKPQLQS